MTNWDACCLVIDQAVHIAQYLVLKLLRLDRFGSALLSSEVKIFGWEV